MVGGGALALGFKNLGSVLGRKPWSVTGSFLFSHQDPRTKGSAMPPLLLHKRGNKVTSLSVHPRENRLLASGKYWLSRGSWSECSLLECLLAV